MATRVWLFSVGATTACAFLISDSDAMINSPVETFIRLLDGFKRVNFFLILHRLEEKAQARLLKLLLKLFKQISNVTQFTDPDLPAVTAPPTLMCSSRLHPLIEIHSSRGTTSVNWNYGTTLPVQN